MFCCDGADRVLSESDLMVKLNEENRVPCLVKYLRDWPVKANCITL